MVDAWGKMPSGILAGNLYELGNFDQCLSIDKAMVDAPRIRGQYCLAGLTMNVSNIDELSRTDLFAGHYTSGLNDKGIPRLHLKQSSAIKYNGNISD